MIRREYGMQRLACDICPEVCEEKFLSWSEAVDYKNYNGWGNRKDENGKWQDICPDCLKAGKRK